MSILGYTFLSINPKVQGKAINKYHKSTELHTNHSF